jgi:hypothetical protein
VRQYVAFGHITFLKTSSTGTTYIAPGERTTPGVMHVMRVQVCVRKWLPGNRQGRVAMICSSLRGIRASVYRNEASEQAQIVHPTFLPTEGTARQFFMLLLSLTLFTFARGSHATVHRLMKQALKKKLSILSLFTQSVLRGQSRVPWRTRGRACYLLRTKVQIRPSLVRRFAFVHQLRQFITFARKLP